MKASFRNRLLNLLQDQDHSHDLSSFEQISTAPSSSTRSPPKANGYQRSELDSINSNLLEMYQNLTFKKRTNVFEKQALAYSLNTSTNTNSFNRPSKIKKKIYHMNNEYFNYSRNTKDKRLFVHNTPAISIRSNNDSVISSTVMKPVEKMMISDLPNYSFTSKGRNLSAKSKIERHFHPISKKEATKLRDSQELSNYLNFSTEPSFMRTVSIFKK